MKAPSGAFKRPNGLAPARWRDFVPTSSRFYACSSVCRELFAKFVRSYKNAIFRVFLVKNFGKGLVFFFQTWYVVSNKGAYLDTFVQRSVPHRLRIGTFACLFCYFLHLPSYHLPCLSRKGQRKAMTQPARVTAFSFL